MNSSVVHNLERGAYPAGSREGWACRPSLPSHWCFGSWSRSQGSEGFQRVLSNPPFFRFCRDGSKWPVNSAAGRSLPVGMGGRCQQSSARLPARGLNRGLRDRARAVTPYPVARATARHCGKGRRVQDMATAAGRRAGGTMRPAIASSAPSFAVSRRTGVEP